MGIAVDPRVNQMYSISESGYMIVTDLNSQSSENGYKYISSSNLTKQDGSGLKAMVLDQQRNCLFVATGSG